MSYKHTIILAALICTVFTCVNSASLNWKDPPQLAARHTRDILDYSKFINPYNDLNANEEKIFLGDTISQPNDP